MRWLKQYPIAPHEVMASLESIPTTDKIGGVENHVRRKLIEYFQNDGNMAALLEAMKE